MSKSRRETVELWCDLERDSITKRMISNSAQRFLVSVSLGTRYFDTQSSIASMFSEIKDEYAQTKRGNSLGSNFHVIIAFIFKLNNFSPLRSLSLWKRQTRRAICSKGKPSHKRYRSVSDLFSNFLYGAQQAIARFCFFSQRWAFERFQC